MLSPGRKGQGRKGYHGVEVLVSPVLPPARHSGLLSPDDHLHLAIVCSAIVSAVCLSFPIPLAKDFS